MSQGRHDELFATLLQAELNHHGVKFGFTQNVSNEFSKEFITECIGALDELSHQHTEISDRKLVGMAALLWTYARDNWPGIDNYLILFLSRKGFGPTATMLDKDYQLNDGFTTPTTLMNQFAVSMKQLEFEVAVQGQKYLISGFQKQVWEAINHNKVIGISAPTSAGKSFIILLKSIQLLLERPGNIVYVVPTLSLVSQVARDFAKILQSFDLNYEIETTYNQLKLTDQKIYVLTQEKAIAAFSQSAVPFSNVWALIIDEVQNVERASDERDQRAKILFDLIIEFRLNVSVDKVIISGPRITNIDKLGNDLFGVEASNQSTKSSPVLNLTYSIKKSGKDYFFKIYTDLLSKPISLRIVDSSKIMAYGGSMYTDKYLTFLSSFVNSMDSLESNIVFAPTTGASRKIAEELRSTSIEKVEDSYLKELSTYLASTVHEKFSLSQTVLNGIAYHHGKLPHHVRVVIEDGIRNHHIKNIVCTTTLLQGVNLPVQNIIIRNPRLYAKSINQQTPKLTSYETANLRGRAGRLLKDFVGRTFILDEDSFETGSSQQTTLFENTEKDIRTGYSHKFEQHKKAIMTDLQLDIGQQTSNIEYSFLLTYIRHAILKYDLEAPTRLKEVGIEISDKEHMSLLEALSTLSVSKDICLLNRYWDPFDLDLLSRSAPTLIIPTGASELYIATKLKTLLQFFKEKLPVYFDRFLNIAENPKFDTLYSHARMAEQWLKETPINKILDNPYYDSSDKIEDAITMLQNKISYGFPMLLKPLYDIKVPDNTFLRFIELGAYTPLVRRLIELNIPRETAIALSSKYTFRDSESVPAIKQDLRAIYLQLNRFEKLQLELFISN